MIKNKHIVHHTFQFQQKGVMAFLGPTPREFWFGLLIKPVLTKCPISHFSLGMILSVLFCSYQCWPIDRNVKTSLTSIIVRGFAVTTLLLLDGYLSWALLHIPECTIGWPDFNEGAYLTFFPIVLIKSEVGNLWKWSEDVIYLGPQASEVWHFRGILRGGMIFKVLGT